LVGNDEVEHFPAKGINNGQYGIIIIKENIGAQNFPDFVEHW